MALDALKNFALTTVSTGYNSAATSIVLTTGGGALFPAVPFNAVWWNNTDYPNPALDPNVEIVRVTNISTDTLTITRGQETTSASNKNTVGKTYNFQQSVTAKTITDIDTAKQDVITGTANQIIKTGTVLSTPQDIATSSTPQFARLGIGQAADSTIPVAVLETALGTTVTSGVKLQNTTAAAAGAQQNSPALQLGGQGWKTTATAASQAVDFYWTVIPVQGAAAPTANLNLAFGVNGGAPAAGQVVISSIGAIGCGIVSPSGVVCSGSITAGATSFLGFGTIRSRLTSSADAFIECLNAAQTAVAAVQANYYLITKTANYTAVILDSGKTFTNNGAAGTVVITLPTAAAGQHFWGSVDTAQTLEFLAVGTDIIRNAGTAGGAAGNIQNNAVGSLIHLVCVVAGVWKVASIQGTWTLV